MQLTLFDWPPLASHTACLMAGLAIAHVWTGERPETRSLPAGMVMVTLAKGMIGATGQRPSFKAGDRVVVTGQKQGAPCRFHEESFRVAEAQPLPVLSIPAKDALKALKPLLGARGASSTELSPAAAVRDLPLCDNGPRVFYGSN